MRAWAGDLLAFVVAWVVALAALSLPACGSSSRATAPGSTSQGIAGTTTAGISWSAPPWVAAPIDYRPRLECEINGAAELATGVFETGFAVEVLPGLYTLGGVRAAGDTDMLARRIHVAWDLAAHPSLIPAVRHEFNHVRLWRATGDPDTAHMGPSWVGLQPVVCGGVR